MVTIIESSDRNVIVVLLGVHCNKLDNLYY